MADLEEVSENPRMAEASHSKHEEECDTSSRQSGKKRKRSRKRRNSGKSEGSAQTSPSVHESEPEERREEDENDGQDIRQQPDDPKQDPLPTQEDAQTQFYKDYRRVAEEYDKDFLKKHGEDLDTTLIFAGLFSAVTGAFIIQVDSQLQPDPNADTAALLRVLIYKIDNTTFGNEIPPLPQWTGPPPAMVHVEAIIYASLVTSLFAAFLAMLGKQWLNRYASTDLRGSIAERGRHRQRKLDGINTWYFDFVMGSLPLMLQAALLLLGCALSRYLWEVDITIASVVLGVTSFGLLFYLFIVVAGAVSEVCPYQTPGSHLIRYLVQRVPSKLPSAIRNLRTVQMFKENWPDSPGFIDIFTTLAAYVLFTPITLSIDVYRLGQAVIRSLPIGASHLVRMAYRWLRHVYSSGEQESGRQTAALDLRCISWTFQTSLEKPVHHSIVKYLATIPELTDFDPTLVTGCFEVLVGCVSVSYGKVVIIEGLDRLATASAWNLLCTFLRLSVIDRTSSVLKDLRQRYEVIFPYWVNFTDLPFHSTMMVIHALVYSGNKLRHVLLDDFGPSSQDHTALARLLAKSAQMEYRQTGHRKVSRWILRFVIHSLSLDPLPAAPIVADCLTIIAVDLGCDISAITILDESERVTHLSDLIKERLETIVEDADRLSIFSKHKAISALFPYTIHLEQSGQQWMLEENVHAARVSGRGWHYIQPCIKAFIGKSGTPSLNRAIILMLPFIDWDDNWADEATVTWWAVAVLALPYTEEVGQSVVDVMLQIASCESLRPHIPIDIWAWLKGRPSLPPWSLGCSRAIRPDVIDHIRGLGDIEILKLYLLVVWSEWRYLPGDHLERVEVLIREDFGGIEMRDYRKDLIERVHHILGELDQGLAYLKLRWPVYPEQWMRWAKESYKKLEEVLQKVDMGQ